jgi:hypothetical protein
MPLEVHDDRFVLKCGSCGEELTRLGRTAPLSEAAAAGWGLIVEPNGTYDYACSACLPKATVERVQMPKAMASIERDYHIRIIASS